MGELDLILKYFLTLKLRDFMFAFADARKRQQWNIICQEIFDHVQSNDTCITLTEAFKITDSLEVVQTFSNRRMVQYTLVLLMSSRILSSH